VPLENEWFQVLWVMPRLGLLATFVMFYVIGGRSGKWLRRYLGSIIFTLGLCGIARFGGGDFSPWQLVLVGLYPLVLSMGYGGNTSGEKLRRRATYGIAIGSVGLLAGFLFGVPVMGWLQLAFALSVSLVMGLKNPTSAVLEEATIALSSVGIVAFMP